MAADFLLKETRMRIAMLLWSSSRNQPRAPAAARLPSRSNSTGGKRKSGHLAAGKPIPKPVRVKTAGSGSSCKERNKRRRKDKRIIPGGPKTRGKVHGDDPTPMQQTESLLNQKRSAASLAVGDSTLQATTQRHAPPKRKKRKLPT